MNKENACSFFLGLFYNSLSCKQVKESFFFFLSYFLCEIKCKSLICLITRHNLISEDLGKATDEDVFLALNIKAFSTKAWLY